MPEGDTLFRTATRLRRTMVGRRVTEATSPRQMLRPDELAELAGALVTSVASQGKHLLIEFDSGHTVHSHLGMHGAWHVYLPDEPWRRPERWAGLVLATTECRVVCFQPKTLELLTATQLKRHAYLHRLGPDLLGDHYDLDEIVRRFHMNDERPLGEAIMDQTVMCGVGNVYKSEVLFLERVNPFVRVAAIPDAALCALVERARLLLRKNIGGYPRRTRAAGAGGRLWVYGRSGQPCLSCGATIRLRRQGDLGRSTYWCPECQGEHREPADDARPEPVAP